MFETLRNVCIVGGGPAGLAAAIAIARTNARVTVIDCGVPPIDKACGEGLMPDGIAALRELGIEIPSDFGFPFRGVRFVARHCSVQADFTDGLARGLRRTVLHELLIRHAARAGVRMVWDAKRLRVCESGVWIADRQFDADLIIGADGGNSRIRRGANLDHGAHETRRYGFRRHFRIAPWSAYVEVHWGSRSQIYATPVARDELCLAVVSRDPKLRLQEALSDFPELSARLRDADPVSPEMGALSVSRRLRSVYRNNVALIGDASGSVDAITGEGISVSFRQALALTGAIEAGNLAQYGRMHRKLMARPRRMAWLMLLLDRNPRVQARALTALAQSPATFRALLAVQVGTARFLAVCSWKLLDFGGAFLES